MKKYLLFILLIIYPATLTFHRFLRSIPADEQSAINTKSIEYTDLIVTAPAQLKATGLSILHDVNVDGIFTVTGQECLNNHFFIGAKQLNISIADVPTTILTLTLNANPTRLPICIDFRYFAMVATMRGKPQTNKTIFCKVSLLLNSTTILATLEKTVYINDTKDDMASATLTFNNGSLKLSTQDYTTANGTLFYNIWGVNVLSVS